MLATTEQSLTSPTEHASARLKVCPACMTICYSEQACRSWRGMISPQEYRQIADKRQKSNVMGPVCIVAVEP